MTTIRSLRRKCKALSKRKTFSFSFYHDIWVEVLIENEGDRFDWYFSHAYAKKRSKEADFLAAFVDSGNYAESVYDLMGKKVCKLLNKLNAKLQIIREEARCFFNEKVKVKKGNEYKDFDIWFEDEILCMSIE